MATLPGIADLGPTPTADPTRPVASYDVSAYARGAQAIAQGGQQLGKGIGELGSGIADYALDKSRWEYATAHSDFTANKVALDSATLKDNNYAADDSGQTMPQRYATAAQQQLDKSAALISDPRMRERFTQTMAPTVAEGQARVEQHARGLENNASVAYVQQQGDDFINKAVAAPDDATRTQIIDSHNQLVDGLQAKGAITPEQAVTMKKAWATQYATADYLAAINSNDPARIQSAIGRLQGTPGSGDAVTSRILQVEGTTKNPASSATGAGQFIDSTWLDMIKRYRPDLAQGRSDADILALRGDRNLGRDMTENYRAENEAYLKKQGLPATPGQQYLAHFLGPGTAAAVLKADPNTPVVDALTQAVGPDKARQIVTANRSVLDGQLAGSVAQWADRKMGGGGDTYELLHLNPVVREELLTRGQAALHKQATTDIATFHNSVQDDLAEADRTGMVSKPKTLPDFVQAYGAQHGPQQFAQYQATVQLGADKQRLATMSPPQIDQLLQSYEPKPGQEGYAAAVKRLDALTSAAHEEGVKRLGSMKDDLAEAARSGTVQKPKTRQDFDLALGEDKGGEAFSAYQEALGTASESRMLPSATPGQTAQIVNDRAPQPGPGYAAAAQRQNSLITVAQKLAKERGDDPAQYGVNYLPSVQESWKAFNDTVNDATATPQVRAAMARDYATKQVMEQQRLGVDPDAIRIVPQAYADNIVAKLNAAANDDDPNRRAATVSQIQREAAMWGSYWPQVMGQLGDKVTPLVRAIAADVDANGRPMHPEIMSRLLSLKPTDTVNSILGEAEGDTKAKGVRDGVVAALHDFRASLMPRQLDRDYPGYVGVAEKLAAMHVRDGDSAEAASTKAVNELIGDRYEFHDTWRIPKDAGVNGTDVQAGTMAARAALVPTVAPTDNLAAAKRDLQLTPQEEALYQRHLTNLTGAGGVDNKDGSRSTLFQSVQEHGGRFYNVPTVWDGRIETQKWTDPKSGKVWDVPNATSMANVEREGWDKFPSYATAEEADARYDKMHDYMDRDTGRFMQQRRGRGIAVQPFADDVGLGTDNPQDSVSKIARDGKFITSPANDGLNLYYFSARRGAALPVRGADGKPLLLKWADLAKRAPDAPATSYTQGP